LTKFSELGRKGVVDSPRNPNDIQRNVGHINIGLKAETPASLQSIAEWVLEIAIGKQWLPDATSLLLLWVIAVAACCGMRYFVFKHSLHRWLSRFDLPIRVAHLPSYCSKYNQSNVDLSLTLGRQNARGCLF